MSEATMIRCKVSGPDAGKLAHIPTIEVNGNKVSFALGHEITLPDWAVEALHNSAGYDVEILSAEEQDSPPGDGDGEGAAGVPGGGVGSAGISDGFNADSIIEGTVPEVVLKLAGLTAAELALVEAAEVDREKARAGVLDAIAKAKAELAGGE